MRPPPAGNTPSLLHFRLDAHAQRAAHIAPM